MNDKLLTIEDEEEAPPFAKDYVFNADLWHPEQRGFLLSYDGNDKLVATVANFRNADSSGTYELLNFRSISTANNQTLFASCDTGTTTSFLHIYVAATTGRVTISTQNAAGTVNTVSGTLNVCDGFRKQSIHVKSSGTAWTILVDGVVDTPIVVAGSNTGDWFADITLRDNVTHAVKTTTGDGAFAIANMGQHRIYSRELSNVECATNYARGWKAAPSDPTGLVYNLPCTEGTGNPVETVAAVNPTLTGATWVEGLIDRSTNALTLTSFGSPVWSNPGRAFNGNDNYISCTSAASMNATAPFSVGCWFNTASKVDAHRFIEKGANDDWNISWSSNKVRFIVMGLNVTALDSVILPGLSTWYRLDCVYDGSNVLLYLNGSPDNSGVRTGTRANVSTAITIGNYGGVKSFGFDGILDELIYYNRSLSSQEISQIYNATKRRYGL